MLIENSFKVLLEGPIVYKKVYFHSLMDSIVW